MSLIQLPTGREGRLPSIASQSDEDLPPIEVTLWKCRRQVVATVILSLGVFSLGADFGWSSMGVRLLKEANTIQFDESVMASLYMAGALVSGPVAAYSMLKLGRKYAMLCHAILLTIGWAVIPMAKFVTHDNSLAVSTIYIGRLITGFAGAGCFTIAPIYVGEICDRKIHSRLESIVQFFLVAGNLYPLALGTFLDWFQVTLACSIFAPSLAILILWVPKSPQLLQADGQEEKSKEVMYWLTVGFTEVEKERIFNRMKLGVQLLSADRAMRVSERRRMQERQKLKITSRPVLHPMIVSVVLILFQQISGANLTTTYIIDIFEQGGLTMDPKIGGAALTFSFLIFYGVAGVIVDRMRRKVLLITSALTNGLMLTTLGFYFWFAVRNGGNAYIRANYNWLPLICGFIINIAYSLGVGPISWIVVSEISHPDWQEINGAFATSTYWLIGFLCTLTIPHVRDAIEYHWTFWLHACFCICNTFFISVFVFETYGKTAEEIMEHYKGGIYVPEGEEFYGRESLGSILPGRRKGGGSYEDTSSVRTGSSSDVKIVFQDDRSGGKGDA